MIDVSCIIVAAGEGKRFGSNKIFAEVGGKILLEYSLEVFDSHEAIKEIVVVLNEKDLEYSEYLISKYCKIRRIIRGGRERSESVKNGLREVSGDYVLIHDGARPNITKSLIDSLLLELRESDVVIPAIPVRETVAYFESGILVRGVDRTNLYAIQTPQAFRRELLEKAFEKANRNYTDESSLIFDTLGIKAKMVEGSMDNIKITYPEDLNMFKRLTFNAEDLRIGFGYDSHRLESGRRLILGGVRISEELGCVAHSDGDCLIHSIIDAILGAIGERDIGFHFPDNDPKYSGISSLDLLRQIVDKFGDGFEIINIDSTIKIQRPKLQDYIPNMKENIAQVLHIETGRISIKAKTGEGIGPVGESKLVECETAILLKLKN